MTPSQLNAILQRFDRLSICVVGDFFLDRYLDLDRRLSEVSLETGLEVYQTVNVRNYPGAAGNVAKDLAALGVGQVVALSCIGVDGNGFELTRCLDALGIDRSLTLERGDRFTPTYLKRTLKEGAKPPRELERVDTRNRRRLPREAEETILSHLARCAEETDGIIIVDQDHEPGCGVITPRIRRRLSELAVRQPQTFFVADSRRNIGKFRHVILKPNQHELPGMRGAKGHSLSLKRLTSSALAMSKRAKGPIYVTLGERGCLCVHEGSAAHIPTCRAEGKIDITGAGDSFLAGVTTALCAGAQHEEAALIGNLVASITVEQVGVTGTAGRAQIRRRFAEFRRQQES